MINIRKLEAELWESADLLRAGSKLRGKRCPGGAGLPLDLATGGQAAGAFWQSNRRVRCRQAWIGTGTGRL